MRHGLGLRLIVTRRECEKTRGSGSLLRLDPNPSLVCVENSFRHGQAQPDARNLRPVQTKKGHEDALAIFGLKTDPVVFDRNAPGVLLPRGSNFYPRRGFTPVR